MPTTMDGWLGRVRALLRRHVLLNAAWLEGVSDGPAGRAFVAFVMGADGSGAEPDEDIQRLDRQLDTGDKRLDLGEGSHARFESLRRVFGLSQREADAIWIIVAPELDLRFLVAYRLLWAEPARRHCTEDFVAALLCPHGPYHGPSLFEPGRSPLLTLGIVHRRDDPYEVVSYRPSRRLVDFIAGGARLNPRGDIAFSVRPISAWADWEGYDLGQPIREALADAVDDSVGNQAIICVQGTRYASIDIAVAQIALDDGTSASGPARIDFVVTFDLADLDQGAAAEADPVGRGELVLTRLRDALREGSFGNAIVHIRGAEALSELDPVRLRRAVALVCACPARVVLECAPVAPPQLIIALGRGWPARPVAIASCPTPSGPERELMWSYILDVKQVRDAPIARLASVPCSAGTMAEAIAAHVVTSRPIIDVVRDLIATSLPRLARRVDVTRSWNEVILPAETAEQLNQVRALVTHRDHILETWGMGERANARGVKVLFSGPSGTGKTLTAGLLAREARSELFQVDVSAVMSKWVGETEKHLSQLFRESEASGAALLFDEADALFRQRGSGSDGGERFGVQLVNFLLEAIERHAGVVILTTNFEAAIDTAFARRMSYHIRFQTPGPAQRAALWALHMPSTIPQAPDLDWTAIGVSFEMTGGEIQQAAMRAAVAAVERSARRVTFYDLETAIQSVYRDKGRLPPRRTANRTTSP